MRRSRHTYDESLWIHESRKDLAINIVYCIPLVLELIHETINFLLSTSPECLRDSTITIDRVGPERINIVRLDLPWVMLFMLRVILNAELMWTKISVSPLGSLVCPKQYGTILVFTRFTKTFHNSAWEKVDIGKYYIAINTSFNPRDTTVIIGLPSKRAVYSHWCLSSRWVKIFEIPRHPSRRGNLTFHQNSNILP